MSAVVKLGSKLPGDQATNGLDDIVKDLLKTPEQVRVSLVWHDVKDIRHSVATGEDVPTIEVRRWLPVGSAKEMPQELIDLVLRLDSERLGKQPLPYDSTDAAELESGSLD